VYDGWRRLRALLRGETFRRAHGATPLPSAPGAAS
jgi:hypothetical protein